MRIEGPELIDLACGAAFLGSGGGGDPHYGRLIGASELSRRGPVELVDLESLPRGAFIAPCGWIGAPTVSAEKLPNGREITAGVQKLQQLMGRRVDALLPIEIGGGNGLAPIIAAAQLGLPVVDADGMGRAFPESQMAIFNIRNLESCPAVVTSASGACIAIENCDNLSHERIARGVAVAMGGIAHMFEYPMTSEQAQTHAIKCSVSTAIKIGASIRVARQRGGDPFEALFAALRASPVYGHAGVLFDGKIVDLERETRAGFSIGRVVIESFSGTDKFDIQFQNENLIARRNGVVCALVPDIITVMDRETADSITTERLKYGQRVKVVGAAAPRSLRDAEALSVVGPQAFGFTEAYRPIEALMEWSPH